MDVDFTQVSRKRTRKKESNSNPNPKVKVVENLSNNHTIQPPPVSSSEHPAANSTNSSQTKQVTPHKACHLYSETDSGPFAVYVYSDKSSVIHFSVLAKIVSEIASSDILSINRLGSGKAIVEVRSALAANRLVSNSAFAKYNIRVFIPAFKVLRTGIVRDVDQSLSIECIKNNIKSSAKILDIQRLNRRVTTEGQTNYLPSRTICVKFAGQYLPDEVSLFNALYSVDPYIPKARICYVCYRVGHIGNDCKSSKPRCLYCGGDHDKLVECENKQQAKKCINCGGDHWATSFVCPMIIRHKEVINLAAQKNIPHVEAKKIIKYNNGGNVSNLAVNHRNYPYLRQRLSPSELQQNHGGFTSYNIFSPLESSSSPSSSRPMNYADVTANSTHDARDTQGKPSRNKPMSSQHSPHPRPGTTGESIANVYPPTSNKNMSSAPSRPYNKYGRRISSHGHNQPPPSNFGDTGSNPGSELVGSIFEMILAFLDKIKNLFNNSQFISSIINPFEETISRIANLVSGLNLDFIINLFNSMGFNMSFDATGTSGSNSEIHQQQ
ncbi:hypothetical protein ALC62_02433 [Cyphomyrmex costatus]|uniref:CCHC-type domain-containing protein n=1 Tax=Cyphomyrmex costatus TaxID=456900 RepID=A0A151IN34_9HYME|nr:hypothetical protein ALC62_02433 [Cyphomyrmex costatus]